MAVAAVAKGFKKAGSALNSAGKTAKSVKIGGVKLPAIKQSTIIVASIFIGFLLYVTIKGRLGEYLALLRGVGEEPESETTLSESDNSVFGDLMGGNYGLSDWLGGVAGIERNIDKNNTRVRQIETDPIYADKTGYGLIPDAAKERDGLLNQIKQYQHDIEQIYIDNTRAQ